CPRVDAAEGAGRGFSFFIRLSLRINKTRIRAPIQGASILFAMRTPGLRAALRHSTPGYHRGPRWGHLESKWDSCARKGRTLDRQECLSYTEKQSSCSSDRTVGLKGRTGIPACSSGPCYLPGKSRLFLDRQECLSYTEKQPSCSSDRTVGLKGGTGI